MICPHCGTEYDDDEIVCTDCGRTAYVPKGKRSETDAPTGPTDQPIAPEPMTPEPTAAESGPDFPRPVGVRVKDDGSWSVGPDSPAAKPRRVSRKRPKILRLDKVFGGAPPTPAEIPTSLAGEADPDTTPVPGTRPPVDPEATPVPGRRSPVLDEALAARRPRSPVARDEIPGGPDDEDDVPTIEAFAPEPRPELSEDTAGEWEVIPLSATGSVEGSEAEDEQAAEPAPMLEPEPEHEPMPEPEPEPELVPDEVVPEPQAQVEPAPSPSLSVSDALADSLGERVAEPEVEPQVEVEPDVVTPEQPAEAEAEAETVAEPAMSVADALADAIAEPAEADEDFPRPMGVADVTDAEAAPAAEVKVVPVSAAGLWRRLFALAVDAVPMLLLAAALYYPITYLIPLPAFPPAREHGIDFLVDLALREPILLLPPGLGLVLAFLLYRTLLKGRTLGRRLLKLSVIGLDGEAVSRSRELWRSLLFLLFGALFGLGLLWTGFDRERRGLHDRLARTVVAVG